PATPATTTAALRPLTRLGAFAAPRGGIASTAPSAPPAPPAPTPATAPASSPALATLVAPGGNANRSRVGAAGLDLGPLGGQQLDPRLAVGVDFGHPDLGNVRRTDARAPRPAAEPRAPRR